MRRLIDNLSLRKKFIILGLCFIIPLGIMLTIIVWDKIVSVTATQSQIYGLHHLNSVRKFQLSVHDYALSQIQRIPNQEVLSKAHQNAAELKSTDDKNRYQISPELNPESLRKAWNEFTELGENASPEAISNFHTYLITQSVLPYQVSVGHVSDLSADDKPEIQLIAGLLIHELPSILFNITEAAIKETQRPGKVAPKGRIELGLLCGRLRDQMSNTERTIEKITTEVNSDDTPLRARTKELRSMISDIFEILEGRLANDESTLDLAEFMVLAKRTLLTVNLCDNLLAERLGTQLRYRADELNRALLTIAGTVIFLTFVSIIFGLYLFGSVSYPIRQMAKIMEHADLNTRIQLARRDEIGRMALAFDRFLDTTKAALREAAQTSQHAATSVRQMTEVSRSISDSAAQQTKHTAASTASMDFLQTAVGDITVHANDARLMVTAVEERITDGQNVLNHSIEGIQHRTRVIALSSEKIEGLHLAGRDIGRAIHLIRAIAKQLNLLGINASIEASKAGAQGRGFGIVAEEIRALAERAEQTTHTIDDVVKTIQTRVNESVELIQYVQSDAATGTRHIHDLQKSLRNISEEFHTLTERVLHIVETTHKHVKAANEVEERIRMIDESSTYISKGTRDINQAAEALLALTGTLQDMLRPFKMDDETPVPKHPGATVKHHHADLERASDVLTKQTVVHTDFRKTASLN